VSGEKKSAGSLVLPLKKSGREPKSVAYSLDNGVTHEQKSENESLPS